MLRARATIAMWLVSPPFLQHETAQARAVVIEEGGRPEHAGDDDGVVRQVLARRHHVLPGEPVQEAVREIVEVVQALAQIRLRHPQQPGARVALDPLDGGFGRDPGLHRLAHAPEPAGVVREHAERLENLPVLAAMRDVAALEHLVYG
jgi:hypothetical protein